MKNITMRHLAIDTETELIAGGRLVPRLVCVALQYTDTDPLLYNDDTFIEPFLEWVNSNQGWVIGHNIAYDMAVLIREYPFLSASIWSLYEQGRVWDTGIHERLFALGEGWTMHPQLGKPIVTGGVSLEQLAKGLIGVSYGGLKQDKDSPRLQYGKLIGVPLDQWPPEFKAYALLDAEVTLRVWSYQAVRLQGCKWRVKIDRGFGVTYELPSQTIQVCAAWALHHLGARGMKVSSERLDAWRSDLKQRREILALPLKQSGLITDKDKRNMKAIKERVKVSFGSQAPKTEKGAIQTSNEVLKESGDPLLLKLAEYMEIDKLHSSFLPVLEKAAKRSINPRWNVLVRSGRTSCTGPNLQQLPRKYGVRECFTPREGFIFVGADYGTAELVALAQVCEAWGIKSKMGESIREGLDLHLLLASSLLNISYEEAKKRYEEDDTEVKNFRQLAKVPNFGLPGGLGVEGLCNFAKSSYGLELSKEAAKELKEAWFNQWTEMYRYFINIEQAELKGFITQIFTGRRRGNIGFTDGANTMFQGLVADGAKLALYETVRECYTAKDSPLYGSKPVLFIHDEIIIESPIDKASQAATRLCWLMKKNMKRAIPDLPMEVDPWISAKWSKDNKTVIDESGCLVPC